MADPALGKTVQAVLPPKLPRKALKEVSKSNRRAADTARMLSKVARRFARLDAVEGNGSWYPWTVAYEELLDLADDLEGWLRRPKTSYEWELLAWCRQISPSKREIARRPWTPIEGLSHRFRWLQLVFEEALFQAARAQLQLAWINNNAWWGSKREEIGEASMWASWRLRKLTYHMIWRCIECNAADRLLIRRAHQTRRLGERVFHIKYRPAVRKWEREHGLHFPERLTEKSEPSPFDYDGGPTKLKLPMPNTSNKLVLRYLPSD